MKYIKFLAQVALIAITVVLLNQLGIHWSSSKPQQSIIYPEVALMLNSDSIMDIHRFWGIQTIHDYDWQETAFSLDVPVSELTIDMYMDHLQYGASSKYVQYR